jgi:hypothetical protein
LILLGTGAERDPAERHFVSGCDLAADHQLADCQGGR